MARLTLTFDNGPSPDLGRQPWTVLVLHDLPTGAMDQLAGFLDRAVGDGVEVRADYPLDCVPLRRGQRQWPLDHLVASRPLSPAP